MVDESSVLSSLGGNTITHNQGNGFLVTTLAVAHFFAADTVNANTSDFWSATAVPWSGGARP